MLSIRSDILKVIVNVVERLMAKKVEDRYQKPRDLANAIAEYLKPKLSQSTQEPDSPSIDSNPPACREHLLKSAGKPTDENDSASKIKPTPILASSGCPPLFPTELPLGIIQSLASTPSAGDGERLKQQSKRKEIRPYASNHRHKGVVTVVTLTPDGRYAATGDVHGGIQVWDLTESRPMEFAHLDRLSEIQAIAFAPTDPNYLVYGELSQGKATLQRWDWSENHQVDWSKLTAFDQNGVGCIRFCADGKILAAGMGSQIVAWKVKEREISNRVVLRSEGPPVRTLAVSSDHGLLVTAGHNDSLLCWNLSKRSWSSNTPVETKIHSPCTGEMVFSPDGNWLAMGGLSSRILLWDMNSSATTRNLDGHTSNLMSVQFTSDGKHLISISRSGEIFYWDLSSGERRRELKVNLHLAYHVAVSQDGTRLIAGYTSGKVTFWNLTPPWAESSS